MIGMGAMKAAIRGFISCILPCGSLDVIRIVHCNGRVEEFSRSIKAGEVMKAHPKHVLKRSSLCPSEDGVVPSIVILPPDAELKRGKIYFLMPVASRPANKAKVSSTKRKKKRDQNERRTEKKERQSSTKQDMSKLLVSDQYLSEIMSEKVSTEREQRRGRVGVWRPHLESITEASICEA